MARLLTCSATSLANKAWLCEAAILDCIVSQYIPRTILGSHLQHARTQIYCKNEVGGVCSLVPTTQFSTAHNKVLGCTQICGTTVDAPEGPGMQSERARTHTHTHTHTPQTHTYTCVCEHQSATTNLPLRSLGRGAALDSQSSLPLLGIRWHLTCPVTCTHHIFPKHITIFIVYTCIARVTTRKTTSTASSATVQSSSTTLPHLNGHRTAPDPCLKICWLFNLKVWL